MRVLVAAARFAPAYSAQAVRTGALALALRRAGHDVRVVAMRDVAAPQTLPPPLPYTQVLHVAPGRSGWLGPALRGAARLCRGWRPDVVLGCGGGAAFAVAAVVAWRWRVHWAADGVAWPWSRLASAVIAPAIGYDPAQAPAAYAVEGDGRRDRLTVRCMAPQPGVSLLGEAMTRLGDQRDKVRLEMHGAAPSRRRWLELQREADVLLVLEAAAAPDALVEPLGMLRPVLVLGRPDGSAARMVAARQAGLATDDADVAAAQLRRWIRQKALFGRVPALPPAARAGLSWDERLAPAVAVIAGLAERPPYRLSSSVKPTRSTT